VTDDNGDPPAHLDRPWHDQQPLVLAAGAAGLALLALLVFAVIHTSGKSSRTPDTVAPEPATSSAASCTRVASTTSYTVPSVQTSQENPVVTAPSREQLSTDGPGAETTTSAPTTPIDPYLTTTPPRAGHV
jgi:hypothetical protein